MNPAGGFLTLGVFRGANLVPWLLPLVAYGATMTIKQQIDALTALGLALNNAKLAQALLNNESAKKQAPELQPELDNIEYILAKMIHRVRSLQWEEVGNG